MSNAKIHMHYCISVSLEEDYNFGENTDYKKT